MLRDIFRELDDLSFSFFTFFVALPVIRFRATDFDFRWFCSTTTMESVYFLTEFHGSGVKRSL